MLMAIVQLRHPEPSYHTRRPLQNHHRQTTTSRTLHSNDSPGRCIMMKATNVQHQNPNRRPEVVKCPVLKSKKPAQNRRKLLKSGRAT